MELIKKPFNIDIKSLQEVLTASCPNTDGINYNSDLSYITIVEKSPLTEQEINAINNYYDNLTEDGELVKINRPKTLSNSMLKCKENLVNKAYVDMTVVERKILLGLALTTEEENEVMSLWP